MFLFRFLLRASCSLLLLAVVTAPTLAANERLEIYVHKNGLDGDLWSAQQYPILVEVENAGTGLGIGTAGNIGLDPNAGPLEVIDEENCTFNYSGTSPSITVPVYGQRSAGEFVFPPVRISENTLLLEGNTLSNCPGAGDEAAQIALQNEISNLPPNPFSNYREYISLPVDTLLGREINISIQDGNNIKSAGANPILGYACTVADNNGEIIREGLCEYSLTLNPARAENGIFRVDLVVVSQNTSTASAAQVNETLTGGINAELSEAVTIVGNFLVRTTALLDWSLAIDETGLRNDNITNVYQRALNVVNGFFILALLTIAFLWNFSVIVSKPRLKRMILMFVIGIVSVNFALPITRLFVDGANLLQQTFLVKQEVSTSDPNATAAKITASDILSSYDLGFGGFVGLEKAAYEPKLYPTEVGTEIETNRLSEKSDLYINRFAESTLFNLILVGLTAIGQLLIALILVFRYVIIWFLLIFSPFLMVMAIFRSTRSLLQYWLWLYARWLLIGPILAMILYIVVNVWSMTGVPLESSYAAPTSLIFPNTTNLYLSAPGVSSGFLNTPREVMKYIAALMMLYMAIILPFWLTRPLRGGIEALPGKLFNKKKSRLSSSMSISKSEEHNHENSANKNTNEMAQNISFLKERESNGESENQNAQNTISEHTNTEISRSEVEKMSTKEIINTLRILRVAGDNGGKTAEEKARIQGKRQTLLMQLATRSDKNDELAKKAMQEEQAREQQQAEKQKTSGDSTTGKDTDAAINAPKPIAVSDKAEKIASLSTSASEKTEKKEVTTKENTGGNLSQKPSLETSKSVAQKAHEKIDQESIIQTEKQKQSIQSEIESKKLTSEQERLTSKSDIAEEVGAAVKQDTLQNITSASEAPKQADQNSTPSTPAPQASSESVTVSANTNNFAAQAANIPGPSSRTTVVQNEKNSSSSATTNTSTNITHNTNQTTKTPVEKQAKEKGDQEKEKKNDESIFVPSSSSGDDLESAIGNESFDPEEEIEKQRKRKGIQDASAKEENDDTL